MKALLGLICVLSLLGSFFVFAAAKGAIHEILAGVGFLAFVISLAAVAVIGAIERAAKKIDRPATSPAAPLSSVRYGSAES